MIREKMTSVRALVCTICLSIALTLPACQMFGPDAVREGRQPYNDAIHNTSTQQLFANLVRIANGQSPLFMDVTEVDAAQYIQGSITGGATGIGGQSALQGAGPAATTGTTTAGTTGALLSKIIGSTVGSVGGAAAVQESPTIRYQPLLGNALIQQISTPISANSIANLVTSDWPFLPLLDLTTDSLTPDYEDNWAALNAIAALNDEYSALTITAGKSAANASVDRTKTIASGTAITVQTTEKAQQGDDALVLYLQPKHPNIKSVFVQEDIHTTLPPTAAPQLPNTASVNVINNVEKITCNEGGGITPIYYANHSKWDRPRQSVGCYQAQHLAFVDQVIAYIWGYSTCQYRNVRYQKNGFTSVG